ncbi:hypothetical protein J2S50_000040 [Streptomyces sp. DSM 40167]|nr:hypothetical protein [Streptomyces sp. DSM 40167]
MQGTQLAMFFTTFNFGLRLRSLQTLTRWESESSWLPG